MLANQLFTIVRDALVDPDGERAPDEFLVNCTNLGIRQIIDLRPSANAVQRTLTLVPGSIQTLTDDMARLIHVVSVGAGSPTLVSREKLSAELPNWQNATPSSNAVHYVVEKDLPRFFWLYPPQPGTPATCVVHVSAYPVPITAAEDVIPLNDDIASALVDYLLFRAFMQAEEELPDRSVIQDHWNYFIAAVTNKTAVLMNLAMRRKQRDDPVQ